MRVGSLVLMICAWLFSVCGGLADEGRLLDITVVANETKANKAPWDGIEGAGGGRGGVFLGLPLSGPPDIAVCVVELNAGPAKCQVRMDGKKVISFCQNSFDCDFHKVSVPRGPFGLVIIDLDLKVHDFIDSLLVLDAGRAGEDTVNKLEKKVRSEANRIAPPLSKGEAYRREREMQKLSVSDCEAPCKLRQSSVILKWSQ